MLRKVSGASLNVGYRVAVGVEKNADTYHVRPDGNTIAIDTCPALDSGGHVRMQHVDS